MSLYQDLILDHSRRPRHAAPLPPPAVVRAGTNPLCGDEVTLYLDRLADGTLAIGFTSVGCALCRASASILAELVHGRSAAEGEALRQGFVAAFGGDEPVAAGTPAGLGALLDMRRFASRGRCVLLPWEALEAALLSGGQPPAL